MLNFETKETHWYVDENYVMREKSDADHNKHDSAEVNYHAFCSYRHPHFERYARLCLECTPPIRYPIPYLGMQPISRDHIIYSLCTIMEWGCEVKYLESIIPPIIFDKGKGSYMNLQMWLWTKLITDKKIGKLFYPVALFQAVKNSLWNRMLNEFFGWNNIEFIYLETHNAFTLHYSKSKASLYYPVYAIKLVATMLQYVPKNWFTKQIKKQLLKITPDMNYAIRIMLGDKSVTEGQVMAFWPIDKPRWSQMINPMRNNRTFRYLTEKEMEFNCVDKDYLIYLFNKREDFYE